MTYIIKAADIARSGIGTDLLRQLNEKPPPGRHRDTGTMSDGRVFYYQDFGFLRFVHGWGLQRIWPRGEYHREVWL